MQDGIGSTLPADVELQPPIGQIRQQAEHAEKVRLPGRVGADQHVDRAQIDLRLGDRLVALYFEELEGRHRQLRLSWNGATVAPWHHSRTPPRKKPATSAANRSGWSM